MVQEILFKAIQRTFWKQMHPIPQVNKQNMLEQAVNTEGCHASSGTNSLKLKFWHAMHWWQSPTQRHMGGGEWVHVCATGIPKIWSPLRKNKISFKFTPLLLLFPVLKQVYQERALENNKKKRVVFYIQINLYFCHKTLKANRRFSTQFCQGSPKHIVTITHRFTGHWSILQSRNYVLWTYFFSPFPCTFDFQEQFCTGAQKNKSVRDLTPKAGVSCPL